MYHVLSLSDPAQYWNYVAYELLSILPGGKEYLLKYSMQEK